MKRYTPILQHALSLFISLNAYADGYAPHPTSQDQPWSFMASFGAGNYPVDNSHKNSAIGRFSLGNELLLAGDIALGLELGLQTGNKICVNLPKQANDSFNWLPVKTTLSPTLDFLVTTKTDPLWNSSFFAQLKGGLAYRHWRTNNQIPLNEISQLAGELQAGLGYPLTALANLNLLYQGVFANTPNLEIDPYSERVHLSNIPNLHAVLLGLSVNL